AASAQVPAAPTPQPAHINGTVTDVNGSIIPGAHVTLQADAQQESQTVVANDDAAFTFDNVRPGVAYHLTVSATGFVDWKSDALTLTPGQFDSLPDVKLAISGNAASVIVSASSEEIAVEELKMEEHQNVLGFIPNYYVVYDPNAPPLSSKMKFQL